MDGNKKVKRFIGRKWADITGWILFAAAVVSLLTGVLIDTQVIGRSLDEAVEMTNETKSGYVYLDIYALSEQVYYWHEDTAHDYFYLANDEEDNFYFVLSNTPLGDLNKAQRVYWDYHTQENKPDKPYRVYGVVRKVTAEALKSVAENTGHDIDMLKMMISNEGGRGIDINLTGSRSAASIFEVAAIYLITLSIIWICLGVRRRKLARATLKRLNELGLMEQAAQEFKDAGKSKTPVLLTKNFMFVRGSGVVFPYEDIVLLFNNDTRIIVYTKTISLCALLNIMNMRPQLEALVAEISKRAPHALVGASMENIIQYQKLYPNAKQL